MDPDNPVAGVMTQYITTVLQQWLEIKELTTNFLTSFLRMQPDADDWAPLASKSLMLAIELAPKLKGEIKKEIQEYIDEYYNNPIGLLVSENERGMPRVFILVKLLRNALETLQLTQYEELLN